MLNNARRIIVALSVLALGLIGASCASAANGAAAGGDDAAAVAFIHQMASGKFSQAEADFTSQMKSAVGSEGLQRLWSQLQQMYGAFQGTGAIQSAVVSGHAIVVVRANFNSQAVGLAVAFDSEHRIAGLHLVPPP
jgi:uncharacterized protein